MILQGSFLRIMPPLPHKHRSPLDFFLLWQSCGVLGGYLVRGCDSETILTTNPRCFDQNSSQSRLRTDTLAMFFGRRLVLRCLSLYLSSSSSVAKLDEHGVDLLVFFQRFCQKHLKPAAPMLGAKEGPRIHCLGVGDLFHERHCNLLYNESTRY